MAAELPPAEKLPLAARKNVRDDWESKRAEREADLTSLLGVPWKFDINPLAIWPYAQEDSYAKNSLGACINAYVEGFFYQLKRFLEPDHAGPDGKDELNSIASKHVITLGASPKFSYCGVEFVDGTLRIVFHPERLGSNIDDAAANLLEELSKAPQPTGAPSLSFAARVSIKKDYDTSIDEVLRNCQDLLQNPNLKFEPGFEELGKALKEGKDARDDWERNLGNFATGYFTGFKGILEREKFGSDDLLREGFEEGVPSSVVKLRVVPKLNSGYNEVILDGGALVIQTTPEYWGSNIDYAAEKLVDIL